MDAIIKKVLATAAAQIGIKESPANTNNVIFNTHYYGQAVHDGLWGTKFPWCAAFVWDVFRMAGLSELYYGGGKTASCPTLYRWAKQQGLIVPFEQATAGDIALFSWSAKKNADHVGIVESAKNGVLTTIEGNTAVGNEGNGGMVMRRTRKKNVVLAVFRPAYNTIKKEEVDMTNEEVKALVATEVAAAVKAAFAKPEIYNTVDECPEWSREAVGWAVDRGYIKGDQTGKLGLDATKIWAIQVTYNVVTKATK